MNDGVHVEVLPVVPWLPEIHPLSMTQEPGALVVQGVRPLLQAPDAEGDFELAALGSHGRTERGDVHRGELAYLGGPKYTCESIHKLFFLGKFPGWIISTY